MRQITAKARNLASKNSRFFSLFLVVFLTSCFGPSKPVHITGETMGTIYNVKYHPADGVPSPRAVEAEIGKLLKHINGVFSTYIPTSEISRLNRDERVGEWIPISGELESLLRHALRIARQTSGSFDPTLGPLVNLWGFGPDKQKKVPEDKDIQAAKERVGYEKLQLEKGKLKKQVPGMYLDLSASAKGLAVDRIAGLLSSFHATEYMVEIGGEVFTAGEWTIGLEGPGDSKLPGTPPQKVVRLSGGALAGSGSWRNYFQAGDKKYSHIIDRLTGRPVRSELVAVTVFDPGSCANADALATALMAMGWEKARGFITDGKLAARLVRADGTTWAGAAFDKRFGE